MEKKLWRIAFLTLGIVWFVFPMTFSQETQTESVTMVNEEQTASVTLETVISLIQENPLVPEKKLEEITLLVTAAVELGILTPDSVAELLDTVGWANITAEDKIGLAVRALELALAVILSGEGSFEEVISELEDAVETGMLESWVSNKHPLMPFIGVLKAIREAGLTVESLELIERIAEALASGIPPGHVVSRLKRLSHEGVTEEELLAVLDELMEESGGKGAGKGHKECKDESHQECGSGASGDKGKGQAGNKGDKGGDGDNENGGKGKGKNHCPGKGGGKDSGKGNKG